MRRLGFLLLIWLLAACGTANVASPTVAPVDEAAEPPRSVDANAGQVASSVSGEAITPAGTVAEASVIRQRDWTKGSSEPTVTIIEYGDFQ